MRSIEAFRIYSSLCVSDKRSLTEVVVGGGVCEDGGGVELTPPHTPPINTGGGATLRETAIQPPGDLTDRGQSESPGILDTET